MTHYDVLVIGSGFGGSVSALRLSEKGYTVGVLEAGRRWDPEDFPDTSKDPRQLVWLPRLKMTGTMRISPIGTCTVVSAAAVGGGSIIYGNTLYEPLEEFWTDPQWAHITDWKAELAPYYDQAKRMLGAEQNPRTSAADDLLLDVARDLGVADTFHRTQVGVFFGEPGRTVPDPFFGGAGPDRTGCTFCARCFSGCPVNAKNTLLTNYLYLAESAGAQVHELTTVTDVRPLPDGGYEVTASRSDGWLRRGRRTFTADQVIFSAAALGTQKLLHRLKQTGALPHLSDRLGELSRTNSEAGLMAMSRTRRDMADGVAISASIHPEPHTHVEICRYGPGQDALLSSSAPLIDGGPRRPLRLLGQLLRHPLTQLRLMTMKQKAEGSAFILVMQSLNNSVTSYLERGRFGWRFRTRQGIGEPNPDWIPIAHRITRSFAAKMDGEPRGSMADPFNQPVTAHYLGGAVIGLTPADGVIDPYQRVFGHPGLHVVDGSAVSANLGVNPSLTITAQSERAVALWPNKGEPDPRPTVGEPYVRLDPVPPRRPVVPVGAPGELRIGG
ncbi:cholesterol oxidase [Marmoricola sp. OAE513]|uniref:GMC oxidoreductase n=1 Tax=Marmoricola sp. OAE513 TaxID=2817894 RepID=UPI001AE83892